MFTRHAETVQVEAQRQVLALHRLEEEGAVRALRKAHSQELAMLVCYYNDNRQSDVELMSTCLFTTRI